MKAGEYMVRAPYGKQVSLFQPAILMMEASRYEPTLAAFLISSKLSITSLELFANDKQKEKYLRKLVNFDWISGW